MEKPTLRFFLKLRCPPCPFCFLCLLQAWAGMGIGHGALLSASSSLRHTSGTFQRAVNGSSVRKHIQHQLVARVMVLQAAASSPSSSGQRELPLLNLCVNFSTKYSFQFTGLSASYFGSHGLFRERLRGFPLLSPDTLFSEVGILFWFSICLFTVQPFSCLLK